MSIGSSSMTQRYLLEILECRLGYLLTESLALVIRLECLLEVSLDLRNMGEYASV